MSKQVQQQINKLFSLENSGGMRVFLFAKFYEDLLREYFKHNGYEVYSGKPRIFWKKISLPSECESGHHQKNLARVHHLTTSVVHQFGQGQAKEYQPVL
jgi:hypothetical protein